MALRFMRLFYTGVLPGIAKQRQRGWSSGISVSSDANKYR
jgi:hypothetical protein